MNNVVISPNIKRQTERIDTFGNVINPATKQVIVPNVIETVTQEDMIPKQMDYPKENIIMQSPSPITIQQQIDEAKAKLIKLEELKKLKIEEMKAQLALLEQ